jgi:hypothetical protein
MRQIHPDLATQLLRRDSTLLLPPGIALRLALTKGPHARITGAISGFHLLRPKVNGQFVGISSWAQIYFPPLAWQLANADNRSADNSLLLDEEGWADASSWFGIAPAGRLVDGN